MLFKFQKISVAILLFVVTGCESENAVEIPKNPAPPPSAQPRLLEGASETTPRDRQPTQKEE
ncbi:hypothetical protein Pla144_05360 [Bythopirellula polymerisocia]|uniref:Uncharacterized protein n=1 Tax=Bythopirellula polymerisocia TaxID=2528003 RepID=A0A5C6D273_9BACT|nr:hypothetical protein Pla144_05360 [Bythopirellula polymerisocia]